MTWFDDDRRVDCEFFSTDVLSEEEESDQLHTTSGSTHRQRESGTSKTHSEEKHTGLHITLLITRPCQKQIDFI